MLKLTNLEKSFNDLNIVKNLSLEVEPGEILALVGPSGCGKSTLMNMISGLIEPDKGTIEKKIEKIGYLFQGPRLLPWRTVFENVSIAGDKKDEESVNRWIKEVGLKGFENYYPQQLSGGMKRRCALARALYYGGNLLLMDEPFSGLDYGIRMDMLNLLLDIWRREKPGILFVTHEIDEVLKVANRVALLSARPLTIQEILVLPGSPGRNTADPELEYYRKKIIDAVTKETKKQGEEETDGKITKPA